LAEFFKIASVGSRYLRLAIRMVSHFRKDISIAGRWLRGCSCLKPENECCRSHPWIEGCEAGSPRAGGFLIAWSRYVARLEKKITRPVC
jgi:hypothetical protein